MRGILSCLLAGFGLAVLIAGSSFSRSAALETLDEHNIRKVLDDQVAAWNRGDIDAFMQGYLKSDQTEFVGAGGILRGWSAVLDRYRRDYPDAKARGELTFGNLEIRVLSPDYAYALGEFHLKREKDNPSGAFTLILRKTPDGWRIIHDHSTAYRTESPKPQAQ